MRQTDIPAELSAQAKDGLRHALRRNWAVMTGGSVLAPITGAVPASKDAPVSKGGPTGESPK